MTALIKKILMRITVLVISILLIILLVFAQTRFNVVSIDTLKEYNGPRIGEMGITVNTDFYLRDVSEYIRVLTSGSFGQGYNDVPISRYLDVSVKRTLILLVPSFLIAVTLGVLLGIIGGQIKNRYLKNIHLTLTVGVMSIPDIFLVMLVQFMVIWLIKHDIRLFSVVTNNSFMGMVLPYSILILMPTQYISRVTTTAIDHYKKEKFIMTATGKGASRTRLYWVHIMRNALIDIVGSLGSVLSIIISCQLLVEYMFAYPGLAFMMFEYGANTKVIAGASINLIFIYFLFIVLFDIISVLISPYKSFRTFSPKEVSNEEA